MATTDVTRGASPLDRLREHVRDPMSRSGYALILGSAITSALGMGFWVLAARLYTPAQVGTASALLAAMGFLGNVSTIGLRNGFVRFLPVSGASAPRFIRNAYLGCIGVAVVAAVIFLIGQPFWAHELGMVREGPVPIAYFVVATAAWTIFVLQDSVLTGLRMASWVPAENAVFAVSKLLLLAALVSLPRWGIYLAWTIPAIVLLLPVNLLIRRRLLSRPAEEVQVEGASLRDVVRFAAGDHVAAFMWLGTTELLSLVVLAQAGPEASAFYFLSFTIAYSLYLVTSNVSSAFVVEAAVNPDQEAALVRKAVLQSARVVVPSVAVAVAGAPLILGIVGSEYEANGVPLLRLLLLSAVPQILVGIAVGRARLHRHVRVVMLVYAVTAVALFSGATFGLRAGGLEAVGWTWLVTQLTMATVLTPTVLHPPLGRWLVGGAVRRASKVRTGLRQRGRAASARGIVPKALASAGADPSERYTLLPSHHDAIVVRSTIAGEPVVGRIAMTESGAGALQDGAEMIERLAGHRQLARWHAVVPDLVHRGEVDGRAFVVESFLPGTPVDRLSGAERAAALERATTSLGVLHGATSRSARFDDSVARRWIDEPIETLGSLAALQDRPEDLRRLRAWLRAELLGRDVELCWVHGDFWAGNVLAQTGPAPRVTGIIDWENGRLDGLAEVDLAHLWLVEQSGEIGAALVEAVADPATWSATRDVDGATVVGEAALPARAVLVLAWLSHVAAGVERSTDHPPGRIWVNRNVVAVLDRIDDLDRAASPEPAPADADEVGADPADVDDPVDLADAGEIDAARAEEAAEPVGEERPTGAAFFELSPDAVAPIGVQPPKERRPRGADLASVGLVAVAAAAWVVGLWGVSPREMTELGIVSLLTPWSVAALGLLVVGFVLALRRNAPGWVYAVHLVVLILLVHGTPAVLYGTLRYSWAWKHTGIVDFIMRNGEVDTTARVTPIYHSWPGFFASSALLTDLVGARHSARIAMWAPVAFNLLNLMAVRLLFRSLLGSQRMVWLAVWLFTITNWVGQDYFSPQAMAYFLYVVMIAVALRGFRRSELSEPPLGADLSMRAALPVVVLLLVVIASSHQITPFLAMVVLAGLVLFRQIRGWYLPVIAGLSMGLWAFTVGNGELTRNTQSLVDSFGRPISNAGETLDKASGTDASQQIVSQAGRLVVLAVAALAFLGVVRLWRRKQVDPTVLVIAATPAALPFATEFGGEAIFRVFLFAVPAMALLGAAALELRGGPRPGTRPKQPSGPPRWSVLRTTVVLVVSAALLTGYVVAYYGKDQQYFFSKGEISAAQWVAEHARPGSLLVEGSRNYPSQAFNYDYFTYVAISREPTESKERVLADPAGKLGAWLDNDEYTDTFVLLTRSQGIEVDLTGEMPKGTIGDIERELRASDRFAVVYENRDAVVFRLAADVAR